MNNQHGQRQGGNREVHDNNLNSNETVGVIIIGILFILVLLAMLRSQKRERQLMNTIADLREKLATPR